ncbi:MAG TPA: GDSL-type esterase/lipase family protein [Kofleriaceae bacterium]|jgi:lysophospholipase L1-like esterase|nr:GDSL-type esterase/lipase family protein [Kofleriaceae bacterium]
MRSKILSVSALAGISGRALAATAAMTVVALGAPGAAAPASAQPSESSARPEWVGTWATALTAASPFDTGRSLSGFEDESIRMIVQTSVGGGLVRIRLSNAHGDRALTIGHATVARPASPSAPDLEPHSVKQLSFRGRLTVTVPAGEEVVSDPLPMFVQPLSQLAVTIYLPQATGPASWHWFARQTAFVYDGDHAADPAGDGSTMTLESFYFLAGVEVRDDERRDGAVVVLGDSISDGPFLTLNANQRWPDFLAQRISRTRHGARELGILNVALSGNAAAHDGDELGLPELGPSGLNRLGEHVFDQPGVRTVIVELGLNDIFQHDDSPEAIVAGLQQIAVELHQHGLRVLLSTLVPATGDPSWTPVREATRQAVNQYVRTTRDADGVVDLDLALRDPANPAQLNPAFDGGDHVHPNAQGNMAIAAIVPLSRL